MQASLFDLGAPTFDPTFRGVRRMDLGSGAWLEYAPRFLVGHAEVFRALRDGTRWQARRRPMYDRVVDVPRLLARFPQDGELPPVLDQVTHVLSRRYGRPLDRLAAAYYRDGDDSVAPHGDRLRHRRDAVVAVLSLGEPRRFLLRPTAGGEGHDFSLGWGDLLVMGGTCQDTYTHGVPKCAFAGPRISVQFREAGEELPRPSGERPADERPGGSTDAPPWVMQAAGAARPGVL